MRFVAADPAVLATMKLQHAQAIERECEWTVSNWQKLVSGSAYAEMLMRGNACMGAGGFWLTFPGMARAWASISVDCDRWALLAATRQVRRAIDRAFLRLSLRRMETTVRVDFRPGHRWAKALGFEYEGVMRRYGPDGTDHALYGQVR